ncbi:MAG: GAK system CofD-like protein [Desulfobacterales bacterium]|nr:GAK system CofD-like protein [Desulfobacterales bacterium]
MLVKINRLIQLPDPLRVARYKRVPELGPKILFFSGGTALRQTCHELIEYTHNSIHIISTFDSGGSSAKLRKVFKMPAIGDIRNRLMALADRSLQGNPEIFSLFSVRFPEDADNHELFEELQKMIQGKSPLIKNIPAPMRKIIRNHLYQFQQSMPDNFDLRKASIGNLVLTAGYLNNQRHLDPMIFLFSKLVQVRGKVRPVLNKNLELAAVLENGNTIVGQHLLTGKEVAPIQSKITRLYLTLDQNQPESVTIPIRKKTHDLINEAELICYPMGSFFSSIIANFLPKGIGTAISKAHCPKIFIPNTTHDPELYGYDLTEQVECLISYLKQDNPDSISIHDILNFIIIDESSGMYQGELDKKKMQHLGIEVINCPLISDESRPYIDARLLVPILLSFI